MIFGHKQQIQGGRDGSALILSRNQQAAVLECDSNCKRWRNFPRTMRTHFSHSCPFPFRNMLPFLSSSKHVWRTVCNKLPEKHPSPFQSGLVGCLLQGDLDQSRRSNLWSLTVLLHKCDHAGRVAPLCSLFLPPPGLRALRRHPPVPPQQRGVYL